jgi:membrane associated rhomboid family serine protease
MIPLRALNPTRRIPALTLLLIGANVVVFAYQSSLDHRAAAHLIRTAGLIPFHVTHHPDASVARDVITSMFLHVGWLHLLSNMLYLWIFGANIEDAMGSLHFAAFYLACGILAALSLVATQPDGAIPVVGASGAISGVLGAYLVLFPGARVQTLVFLVYVFRVVKLRAAVVLVIWFLGQFLYSLSSSRLTGSGGVAYAAHIGGFIAGAVLALLFRVRRLQDRPTGLYPDIDN